MRIESLRKSRHTSKRKELEKALEGARHDRASMEELVGLPWDEKNHKPWTSGFMSASPGFFRDAQGNTDPDKVEEFLSFAEAYLRHEFGRELIYLRADLDEETPHVHCVISPEHQHRGNHGPKLSHSSHRLFGQVQLLETGNEEDDEAVWKKKSYELFQDRVAAFADDYGIALTRGEKRAAAEREAASRGEKVTKVRNVPPRKARTLASVLVAEAEAQRLEAESARRDAEAERDEFQQLMAKAQASVEAGRKRREADAAAHETAMEQLEQKTAAAEALMTGITVGMEALEKEELRYVPPAEERKEGLGFGVNAPKEKSKRQALVDAVRPACDWLIGIARGMFLRQKEADAQDAENRRRAALLEKDAKRLARPVPAATKALASDAKVSIHDVDDFPDAWAYPADGDHRVALKQLNAMPNLILRSKHLATVDAVLLTEELPELRKQFLDGQKALEAIATARGFDLETGIHDPKKATVAAQAHRHTDSFSEPWKKVVRKTGRGRDRER